METNKEQHLRPENFSGKTKYDMDGQMILSESGLPVLEMRGYGEISNHFETLEEADAFQDRYGEWVSKCINAMEGIEDPEEWVNNRYLEREGLLKIIDDLQKYKTACESINKDNPLAVIEFLPNLLEDVNSLIQSDNFCKDYPATSRSLLKLLTKIQEGKQS